MDPSVNASIPPSTIGTNPTIPPFITLQDSQNIPPPLSQAPTLTDTKAEDINTQTLRDELSKALENKPNVLARIITQGIGNPHAIFGESQVTILEYAILNCPVISLRLLEHPRINVNYVSIFNGHWQYNALNRAAERAIETILPLDDNRADESEKRPAYIELLKACCQKGFTPNLCGSSGHSALMRACMAGDEEVVQILLEHHADISLSCNQPNHIQSGYTPLHYAITGRHISLAVGLILIHRANPMAQAANLNSPLFCALTNRAPILRDLFFAAMQASQENKTQLDLNTLHQNGTTLLHAAVEAYNRLDEQQNEQADREETNITDAIAFLLMCGVNKNIQTTDTRQTAAQMADSAGNNELASHIREFVRRPTPTKGAHKVQ